MLLVCLVFQKYTNWLISDSVLPILIYWKALGYWILTSILQHSNFLYPKEVKGIGKIYYLYSTICRNNKMQFRHVRIAIVLETIFSCIQYFSKLKIRHSQELLFVPDQFILFSRCYYSILDSFHLTFIFVTHVFCLDILINILSKEVM